MTNQLISENLRHLRKIQGFTQEELSSYLQIKRQTYSLYERGLRLPNIIILLRLSALYQISLDVLVKADLNSCISDKATLQMLEQYKNLSSAAQSEVQEYIKFKAELEKENLPFK